MSSNISSMNLSSIYHLSIFPANGLIGVSHDFLIFLVTGSLVKWTGLVIKLSINNLLISPVTGTGVVLFFYFLITPASRLELAFY